MSKRDTNQNVARIVKQSTGGQEQQPVGLEAAWKAWASHLQRVDDRTMTLLRAAFEAGWAAGASR